MSETIRYEVTIKNGYTSIISFTQATRDNRPCVIVAITSNGRTACDCIPADIEEPFADWCADWIAANLDPDSNPTWHEI